MRICQCLITLNADFICAFQSSVFITSENGDFFWICVKKLTIVQIFSKSSQQFGKYDIFIEASSDCACVGMHIFRWKTIPCVLERVRICRHVELQMSARAVCERECIHTYIHTCWATDVCQSCVWERVYICIHVERTMCVRVYARSSACVCVCVQFESSVLERVYVKMPETYSNKKC